VTDRLQLSAIVHLGKDTGRSLERAVALEQAGIDVIGIAEAYGVDAVSLLGYVAAKTTTAKLMSAILPLYSRTPTLVAMTAAGLDIISNGRFILGLGASGPQVIEGWHGVPYDAPIGRTRETIEICRSVWKRERVEYSGKYFTLPLPPEQGTGLGKPLKLITHPLRDDIPVFLAALGEKNVELTAEVAQGWIPFLFIPELADQVWGDAIARGAEKRDASLGTMQIVAGAPLAIGSDTDHLRDTERPHIALYVGGMGARGKNFYNDVAARYGFEAEAKEIQDLYLSGKREEAEAAVPQAMIDGMSLIGDEASIKDRLAAYVDAGVTMLQIEPVGPDPIADVRRLRELVESI
jgi:F420-dependent oxidoreductase-like protein